MILGSWPVLYIEWIGPEGGRCPEMNRENGIEQCASLKAAEVLK